MVSDRRAGTTYGGPSRANNARKPATNIGSRLYLMASASKYQMFSLLGNEFTFDVDVSKLG